MEILQYHFIWKALTASLLTAIICPIIGIFVVTRRQALIGDGIGHLAFAGIMIGYYVNFFPLLSAIILIILGAILIEYLRRKFLNYADVALAIIFYTGMALGVFFSNLAKISNSNMLSYLFGNVITISNSDLILIFSFFLFIIIYMSYNFKKILLATFDEDSAYVSGIETKKLGLVFNIIVALTVVIGIMSIGVLLIGALLILPTVTSLQYKKGFIQTIMLSELSAIISVLIGLSVSFFYGFAPGATIVLVSVFIFFLSNIYLKIRSINL